jgi:dTMP kinase
MVGKLRALRSWRAAGGSALAESEPGRPYPGWFIAVEGGDGAGKSTQIAAVADWLRSRGFTVVTTREPGATPLGSVLRNLVLHAQEHKLGARAEALLFAADRADHMETVVRPALERGAVVLTDRHVDSSVAYQSGGRGLPAHEVAALSAFATEGVRPDLVVLLDLDPAVARARREERTGEADKLEAEAAEFHERVRATFLDRAKAEPGRYLVLDATQSPRILTGAIQDRLDGLLPPSAEEAADAAARAAEIEAHITRERDFRQALAAEEKTEREAAEAASREQQERVLAERYAAERERSRQAAERAAAAEAEERARREKEQAEAAHKAEQDRIEAERQENERRMQLQRDALRRREHELAMRQAESRAKERARLAAAAAKAAAEQAERLREPVAGSAAEPERADQLREPAAEPERAERRGNQAAAEPERADQLGEPAAEAERAERRGNLAAAEPERAERLREPAAEPEEDA